MAIIDRWRACKVRLSSWLSCFFSISLSQVRLLGDIAFGSLRPAGGLLSLRQAVVIETQKNDSNHDC
ncbi:hypothetical protein [Chromobacterium sp. Beijing]|uniref:hypothetical protein n=1 Tax=Chromobacterium sp. Beijing TaxID=2735795 RepID=UPI001F3F72C6|nr:hypothetical protein [Chromobacterium sp. Beijing]